MKQSLINITVERLVKHSQRVKTSNFWSRLLVPLKSELPHFYRVFYSLAWMHAAQCIPVNNLLLASNQVLPKYFDHDLTPRLTVTGSQQHQFWRAWCVCVCVYLCKCVCVHVFVIA